MSSLRRRLHHILDIVLRVPPLFIMDSIFVNNMKLPQFSDTFSNTLFNNFASFEGDNLSVSTIHSPFNKSTYSTNTEADDFFITINNTSSIILAVAYAIGEI